MYERNTAQNLYHALGVDIININGIHQKYIKHYTKKGPGRSHKQGKVKSNV